MVPKAQPTTTLSPRALCFWLPRLKRLGEGGESCRSSVLSARAVVEDRYGNMLKKTICYVFWNVLVSKVRWVAKPLLQEVGQQNVSHATSRLARVKHTANASRDLFRYARLPVDPVWVETIVLTDPVGQETREEKLPMFDPHELLDYLWRTDKISVQKEDILNL